MFSSKPEREDYRGDGSRTTPLCKDDAVFLEMRNRTCNECPHRLVKDGTLGRTCAVKAEETMS